MNARTIKHLLSLGVRTPICTTCLSDDFENFMVLNGSVLWCEHCNLILKDGKKTLLETSKHSTDDIETQL